MADLTTTRNGALLDAEGAPTSVVSEDLHAGDYRLEVPTTEEPVKYAQLGRQYPSHFIAPLWTTTAGDDAVDLAEACGLHLLPWQQVVLRNALGERPGGKWSSFEVGLIVPRQNGKNVVVMARQLAGLFLFGEEQQVHTAHKFKTAKAAHRDLVKLIENQPELDALVAGKPTSSENTSIVLSNGHRLDFLARKSGGGRGLSGDTVYLDEAFALDQETLSDLLPTLSARPSPQVWYTSSAGMDASDTLLTIRERATKHAADQAFFTYCEWSADLDMFPRESVEAAAYSNPSMGWFQDWEWINNVDLKTMGVDQYNRERLGVWVDQSDKAVIGAEAWNRATVTPDDLAGVAVVRRSLAVEVTADRDMAVIAGAAELEDGRVVVDILDQRAGTAWVANACMARNRKNPAWAGVVIDSYSGAAAVAPHIIAAGVPVTMATTKDLTAGTADFYDRLTRRDPDTGSPDPGILHSGDGSGYLDDAAYTARKRLVGTSKTAWTWDHGVSEVPLAPLRAVTLAVKGLGMEPVKRKRRRVI